MEEDIEYIALYHLDNCTFSYVIIGMKRIMFSDALAVLCCWLLFSIKCHLKHNKLPSVYPITAIMGNHKVKTEAAKITRQRKL